MVHVMYLFHVHFSKYVFLGFATHTGPGSRRSFRKRRKSDTTIDRHVACGVMDMPHISQQCLPSNNSTYGRSWLSGVGIFFMDIQYIYICIHTYMLYDVLYSIPIRNSPICPSSPVLDKPCQVSQRALILNGEAWCCPIQEELYQECLQTTSERQCYRPAWII